MVNNNILSVLYHPSVINYIFYIGPPVPSLFLRVGWSVSDVVDRYHRPGNGSDQTLGRILAGLSNHSIDFGELAPHFIDNSYVQVLENNILPYYQKYPTKFTVVIPFLLASVVYHRQYLRETLHSEHKLFKSRFWMNGYQDSLSSSVVTGINECKHTSMFATGIPKNIMIATEVRQLGYKLQNYNESLTDTLKDIPINTADEILSKCEVKGAVPVTKDDLTRTLKQVLAEYIPTLITNNTNSSSTEPPNNDSVPDTVFSLYNWSDGSMHPVPEHFKFPNNINTKTLFELWYRGNVEAKIGPYKSIQSRDLEYSKDHINLCRANKLMKWLTQNAINNNRIDNVKNFKTIGHQEFDTIFSNCFSDLCASIAPQKDIVKLQSNSYVTIAKGL